MNQSFQKTDNKLFITYIESTNKLINYNTITINTKVSFQQNFITKVQLNIEMVMINKIFILQINHLPNLKEQNRCIITTKLFLQNSKKENLHFMIIHENKKILKQYNLILR